MKTLDLAPLPNESSGETPWRDRIEALVDRWMTSDALYRWSVSNPLTRWVTRSRTRKVFDLMAGFVYSQVLLSCVRLRILETVAERPPPLKSWHRPRKSLRLVCSAFFNRPRRCNCSSCAAGDVMALVPWVRR